MTDDQRGYDGAPAGDHQIVLGPPPPDVVVHWAPPPRTALAAGPIALHREPMAPPPRTTARRGLVIAAVVGLAVGLAGGAATGFVVADDQEQVDRLSADVSGLRQDLVDAEGRRRADVEAARRDTEAGLADDIARQQAELDHRAEALDGREADLDDREDGLDDREADLTVLEEQAADGSIPGDGLYLVGEEVEPGTYRASHGADCYWERLSGASGDFGDLITNGLGAADATVTIQASDYAFSTQSCGSWTRLD
jgi:outer membrane murein-binding lipoprotein Lpp